MLSLRQEQLMKTISGYGKKPFRLTQLSNDSGLTSSQVHSGLLGLLRKEVIKKDRNANYFLK